MIYAYVQQKLDLALVSVQLEMLVCSANQCVSFNTKQVNLIQYGKMTILRRTRPCMVQYQVYSAWIHECHIAMYSSLITILGMIIIKCRHISCRRLIFLEKFSIDICCMSCSITVTQAPFTSSSCLNMSPICYFTWTCMGQVPHGERFFSGNWWGLNLGCFD